MRDDKSSFDDTVFVDSIAPQSSSELLPGAVFAERYRVDAKLGEGGMGAVYRVRDLQLDETVALKIVTLPSREGDDQFLDEVRLARRVTHRNVARTHDIGVHMGVRFLTMECVEGIALDDELTRVGKLEAGRAALIARQVAAALETAHAAGVIHRDLKPANILLAQGDRAVITDFGIARAMQPHGTTGETQSIIGTPLYMSPEQALGVALDARSDLYSLGVILYELVTGKTPFEGADPLAILRARLEHAPPHPGKHNSVPAVLAELVMWLMARDPDRRPGSATEVRESLESYLQDQSSTGKTFAPLGLGDHPLAVLPFVYRGPADHDYLGEGLAEELIDTLSRTRGLKVWSLGATRRFAAERDPMRVGVELGAASVVDGTLQLAADRVKVTARLVSARDGVVQWTERYDVSFADVMSLQESLGRRLAEALRLEVSVTTSRADMPREATELYLRARALHRREVMSRSDAARTMLEQCLALAPGFKPALSAYAMAAVRTQWLEGVSDGGVLTERARVAVEACEREAPALAETHLARGMLFTQIGSYRDSVAALLRAIAIAPTLAEAHYSLGTLQTEAGRAREGVARLEMALDLDPQLNVSHLTLARVKTLLGDHDAARAHVDALRTSVVADSPAFINLQWRMAVYRGDRTEARALHEHLVTVDPGGPLSQALLPVIEITLGEDRHVPFARNIMSLLATMFVNKRLHALFGQVAVEALACTEHFDAALEVLSQLADGVLADLLWLDVCALFDPVRDDPRFAEASAKVRHRATSMWLGHEL